MTIERTTVIMKDYLQMAKDKAAAIAADRKKKQEEGERQRLALKKQREVMFQNLVSALMQFKGVVVHNATVIEVEYSYTDYTASLYFNAGTRTSTPYNFAVKFGTTTYNYVWHNDWIEDLDTLMCKLVDELASIMV